MSGAASIIGPVAGALLGGIFGRSSSKTAYNRSVEQMRMQHQLDMDMWRHQNAYNTPKAQMDRLRQAGLNPALMYGQGTTGNASNYPQTKFTELTPYMGPAQIAQTTAAGVQMSLADAQRRQMEANAMYTNIKGANETKNTKYQTALMNMQTQKVQEETLTEIQNRSLVIAQENKAKAEKANIDLMAEINKIDKNWLKDNKTSKYEHGIIRAIKSVIGDTKKALEFFLENRFMFEEPPMQHEYRYNKTTGRYHKNY